MPETSRLSCDAIVVGSGAGGAPVAAVLAEAGLDVVLLEVGPRIETREFNGDEGEMTAKLWKMGFAVDSGLSVYAGACVGGSTVINDALCFRTPPEVLERWRRDHGLAGLTESAFAPFVERAWQDLHAEETGPDHTSRNAAALARGAAKLGWLAGPTPRSVKSCASFGLCNYGCPTGAKQSTLVTYVPRAEKAGARVIAGARVERVRIEAGAARGVDAVMADGSPLTVDAGVVCLAAGVLATPAILQKSGIAAGARPQAARQPARRWLKRDMIPCGRQVSPSPARAHPVPPRRLLRCWSWPATAAGQLGGLNYSSYMEDC